MLLPPNTSFPLLLWKTAFYARSAWESPVIPPYSIVYDNIGIYYDTTRPSRLEQLILAADAMPSETLAQARQAMDFILKHHLSKYNHAPELSDNHPLRSPSKSETVLIIDQTFGDMAIQYEIGRAHV